MKGKVVTIQQFQDNKMSWPWGISSEENDLWKYIFKLTFYICRFALQSQTQSNLFRTSFSKVFSKVISAREKTLYYCSNNSQFFLQLLVHSHGMWAMKGWSNNIRISLDRFELLKAAVDFMVLQLHFIGFQSSLGVIGGRWVMFWLGWKSLIWKKKNGDFFAPKQIVP